MSFSLAIQAAIYQRLTNYAPLNVPIYDDVPQGAAFPYITIGDDTLTEWDQDACLGADATLTLHVWSRERGRKQTKQIQGLLYDALHRYPLTVNGAHAVDCLWEMSESFLDPDGHTRHGVSRFRITLQRL